MLCVFSVVTTHILCSLPPKTSSKWKLYNSSSLSPQNNYINLPFIYTMRHWHWGSNWRCETKSEAPVHHKNTLPQKTRNYGDNSQYIGLGPMCVNGTGKVLTDWYEIKNIEYWSFSGNLNIFIFQGYSGGAPKGVCNSMNPGHGIGEQSGKIPYSITARQSGNNLWEIKVRISYQLLFEAGGFLSNNKMSFALQFSNDSRMFKRHKFLYWA